MSYFLLKTLHVVSASIVMASLPTMLSLLSYIYHLHNKTLLLQAYQLVTKCNWLCVLPALIFQLFTGFTIISLQHYAVTATWVIGTIIGFMTITLLWLPLIFIQLHCYDLLQECQQENKPLADAFHRRFRQQYYLAAMIFTILMVMVYFMASRLS